MKANWVAIVGALIYAVCVIALYVVMLQYVRGAEFKAPPKLPENVCAQVRAGVAAVGVEAALQWARDHGYTSTHIMRARKCLKKGEN